MKRILLLALLATLVGTSCWNQCRGNAAHSGYEPLEFSLTTANASALRTTWTAEGAFSSSTPVVSGGVVYVGGEVLHAYDAAGASNCVGVPVTCSPLWTARSGGGSFASSPAVVSGVVYITAYTGLVYAFDAAGLTNCGGSPKVCAPLWTGSAGDPGDDMSSPTVADGVVYVSSFSSGAVFAFDAAGSTHCSGVPKTCTPLWSAALNGPGLSAPAVADGKVYVAARSGSLFVFDAAGAIGCSGTPKTCVPLWTAPTGSWIQGSPAVVDGVAYVVSWDSKLYAFDGAGTESCSSQPKICAPLWTALVGSQSDSSPAVAYGRVYVGGGQDERRLQVFDAHGIANCSGVPRTCLPLWTGHNVGGSVLSPTVANGVVYAASTNGQFTAWDAAGVLGCSGTPKVCSALGGMQVNGSDGSIAIIGGAAYFADTNRLYRIAP